LNVDKREAINLAALVFSSPTLIAKPSSSLIRRPTARASGSWQRKSFHLLENQIIPKRAPMERYQVTDCSGGMNYSQHLPNWVKWTKSPIMRMNPQKMGAKTSLFKE
jgi:hypothetical protein